MISVCMNNIDANYEIEPMLLVPFVENAFKHGTGLVENAEINIELSATKKYLPFWYVTGLTLIPWTPGMRILV